MKKTTKKIYKKVKEMELNNPIVQVLIGLVIFYIGLKMFAGGMKSMGDIEQMKMFIDNPYYMFIGGILMTLLWQSSSLSTTAIIALVSSGALPLPSALAAVLGANIGTTGTIWIAGMLVSDGIPSGVTRQIAIAHTGFNLMMGLAMLPFVYPIARFLGRF